MLPDVQGVLGQSFLSGFDYRLDLRGKRFELGRQDLKGQRFPLRTLNSRATLSTSLGDLVLDSGAAELILFRSDPGYHMQGSMRTIAGSQSIDRVFSKQTYVVFETNRCGQVSVPVGGAANTEVDVVAGIALTQSHGKCTASPVAPSSQSRRPTKAAKSRIPRSSVSKE